MACYNPILSNKIQPKKPATFQKITTLKEYKYWEHTDVVYNIH